MNETSCCSASSPAVGFWILVTCNMRVLASPYHINLQFLSYKWFEDISKCLFAICISSVRYLFKTFVHLKIGVSIYCSGLRVLCIFCIQTSFIRYVFDKCFLPVYGLSFHSFSWVVHRAEFLILMQSNINFSLSWIKLVFDLLFPLNNTFWAYSLLINILL